MSFPTTPLLDNFNRADESPLSGGGNWSGPVESGHVQANLVSHFVKGDTTSNREAESYWTTQFTANQESWFTISTVPDTDGDAVTLWLRTTNQGTANISGYRIQLARSAGTVNSYQVRRFVSGVETDILSTTGTTLANGDQLGASISDASIQIWVNHASGGWSLDNSVTDSSPVTGAGNIGLRIFWSTNNVIQLSNFGGGPTFTGEVDNVVYRPRLSTYW